MDGGDRVRVCSCAVTRTGLVVFLHRIWPCSSWALTHWVLYYLASSRFITHLLFYFFIFLRERGGREEIKRDSKIFKKKNNNSKKCFHEKLFHVKSSPSNCHFKCIAQCLNPTESIRSYIIILTQLNAQVVSPVFR